MSSPDAIPRYDLSGAIFSVDRTYRYELWRRWSDGPTLAIAMLNPSTASAYEDDPTIRKCIGFAKRLGFGGFRVVNLFAARSTDPKALRHIGDPIGRENDERIVTVCQSADRCIVAWGASDVGGGLIAWRAAEVVRMLRNRGVPLWCLGRSQQGHPRHPLMLAYSTPLELFDHASQAAQADKG